MATNLVDQTKNNELREVQACVGKLNISSVAGDLVSLETYNISMVPAGALITGVYITVTEAFNGTLPTADVGITGATTKFYNDLDITVIGTTVCTTGLDTINAALVELTVIPTLSGATTGALSVTVTFIDTECTTGSYIAG